MIAFRASLVTGFAALVFFGAFPGSVTPVVADGLHGQLAQSPSGPSLTGPVRLGPRRAIKPMPADRELESVPARATPAEDPPSAVSPSGEAGPVEVQMLQAVDADSVGVIDDMDGGLGVDMWGAVDRNYIGRVIALLPRNVRSPAMRDLMRRLLLTRAMAPPRKSPGPGLLPLRIDALFALGDLDSALSLISRAPIAPLDEHLLRTEVESRFFRQDTTGACGQVRSAAQDYKDAYWQQAMAYCLALAGKTAEAALLSDILAERSSAVHPAFFAAMDRLSGAPSPKVDSLSAPSALYLSMMRTASLTLPGDVSNDASASVQNAVALSPNASLDLRLAAAERAAERGILPSKTLVEIYGAVSFEEAVLKDPLKHAASQWGPRGRALLMRVAESQLVPAARAEVLKSALQLARKRGGYNVIAVASRPWLAAMTPTSELAWFAGAAGRALIAAGDLEQARRWIELGLKQQAEENPGEAPSQRGLWPLAALMGATASDGVSPEALVAWWQSRNQRDPGNAIATARLYYALLDMLDIAVPSELWTPILGAPPINETLIPGAELQSALRRAAAAGRKGEVVGLALVALGETGPSANNLHAVSMAVRGLRKVGLTAEAQRLVAEAAIAAGL